MNDQSSAAAKPRDLIEISDAERLPLKPVLSVLMLAYNHGPYLADSIEGVLMQKTDFPIELLIGEDCSSDDTREIALRYQREHPHLIRVITSDRNVGMHENFRRIIEASHGEFLALCEGDDYWHHPRKLQLQIEFMRENPQCGFIHTDYDYRVGERVGQSMMSRGDRLPPQGQAFEQFLQGYCLATATIVYRASVFQDFALSRYAANSYAFGDYSRALFAALDYEVGYLPVSTATYRYMSGSAMNSGPASTLRLRKSVIQCRKDFMNESGRTLGNLLAIECEEHRLLYGNSYLARDIQTFDEAARWLASNDAQHREGWRHQVRRLLLHIPALHGVVLWRAHRRWLRSVAKNYVPMTREQQCALTQADA